MSQGFFLFNINEVPSYCESNFYAPKVYISRLVMIYADKQSIH